MMMTYLAEASAANGLSPEAVGILIGGIITALVGGGLLGKRAGKTEGKAEALQVGPQPFMVELKETFVTRREHDRLEAMVAVNATRVEGMFRETMNEVKTLNAQTNSALIRQGERLADEIEKVAKAAYDGRQRLHNHVNSHGEKIAALSVNNDVATELARVSEVIVEAIKETKKPNS
jgi:uncharacterized protein YecA (UPF0149 family)